MESPNSSALSIDSNTQTSTRRWTDEEVKIVKDLLREHVEAENNDESPPMSMIEMWEKFSAQLTERGFHRSATAVQRRFRMQVSMRRESSRVKSESADVVKPDLQNASRSQNVVLGDLEPEANPTRATVNNDEKISKVRIKWKLFELCGTNSNFCRWNLIVLVLQINILLQQLKPNVKMVWVEKPQLTFKLTKNKARRDLEV